MNRLKNSTALFVCTILMACVQPHTTTNAAPTPQWKLVYKNDTYGKPLSGDKEILLKLVRNGSPIRVGWSSFRKNDPTKGVEHTIDANFLTIANKTEVFAQLKPFYGQRPDLTSDTITFTLVPTKLSWILGTNGTRQSMHIKQGDSIVTSQKPKPFGYDISWYAPQ